MIIITQFFGGFNKISKTSKLGERYKKDEKIFIMIILGQPHNLFKENQKIAISNKNQCICKQFCTKGSQQIVTIFFGYPPL